MRILVTADTHGPRHRLPPWLLDAASAADLVLHAGDVCDLATLETLAVRAPVYAVRGNRDLDLPLAESIVLWVEGVSVGIVHGHLGPGADTPERAWRSFQPQPDVVAFGHSHRRLLERRGAGWLVNPGSATRPKDGMAAALVLTVHDGRIAWQPIGAGGFL